MKSPEQNDWLQTWSGRAFHLASPQVLDITFEDIAQQTAKICRFNGATVFFYSVAEHQDRIASILSKPAKPYGLIHDGCEAYGGDDTTPKKRALPIVMARAFAKPLMIAGNTYTPSEILAFAPAMKFAFDRFEAQIAEVVHRAAGLEWPVPAAIEEEVKWADRAMFKAEHRDLMRPKPDGYSFSQEIENTEAWPERITTETHWQTAAWDYLESCHRLLPVFQRAA